MITFFSNHLDDRGESVGFFNVRLSRIKTVFKSVPVTAVTRVSFSCANQVRIDI